MLKDTTAECWHVAYTMPKSEKKAHESLKKAGIRSYVPVRYEWRKWSDRMKKIEMPLFPNYIFIDITPQKRHEALNIRELVRYVCFEGKPAIVPGSVLDALRRISGAGLEVASDSFEEPGTPVLICEGPFMGVKGVLVRRNGKCRLVVRVASLKSSVSLEIGASMVSPLENDKISHYEIAG